MSNYTAILFDLDGTLRLHCPSGLEAYVMFLAEHGISLSAEQLRAGERWAHAYWADQPQLKHAQREQREFWLDYTHAQLHALGVDDPHGHLTQAIRAAFETRYAPQTCLTPSALDVLTALRSKGYTLGLVSNRADELAPLLSELGLQDYFHFTLASSQVNLWKPDPRIFWYACQMGHCEPAASMYVGDNYYTDIIGAQQAGLTPVLYDPRDVFPEATCPRLSRLNELLEYV